MSGGDEFGPEATTDVDDAPAFPVRQGRIVVADDDHDARTLLAAVLRRDGWEVLEMRNGWEVLSSVVESESAPDLIISDVQMPGVTGVGLLEGLREAGCDVPVLLVTAVEAERVREEVAPFARCKVFEKPFDLESLRDAVHDSVV